MPENKAVEPPKRKKRSKAQKIVDSLPEGVKGKVCNYGKDVRITQIEYAPKWSPTLTAAMKSKAESVCIVGPVGSGKSSLAVFKIISLIHKYAKDYPKTRWCVVRNTYRELLDTTLKTYFYWFPHKEYAESTWWGDKYNASGVSFGEYRASDMTFVYQNKVDGVDVEAHIMFRSADDAEAIKKFKSMEIAGYHIDEVIEVPKEIKLILDGRCRYPKGWPRPLSFLTTNPPSERHWVYLDYFNPETKLQGHDGFKQPAGDNAENLPPGYYDRLRAAYANNPDWINRYIEGNWGIQLEGEKVYPEFSTQFHVAQGEYKVNKHIPIIRGFDFGLTPACVFMQLSPEGILHVFDELQEFNMGIDRFSDKVIMHSKIYYPDMRFFDFADPAGWSKSQTDERTCAEIMIGKGFSPQMGEITFTKRRECVASYLNKVTKGIPCFKIYKEKCPILFDGLSGGYHYPKNKDGIVVKESPVKNEMSHLQDALQYAVSRMYSVTLQWEDEDYEAVDLAATYQVA